jgi:hypothetical protein
LTVGGEAVLLNGLVIRFSAECGELLRVAAVAVCRNALLVFEVTIVTERLVIGCHIVLGQRLQICRCRRPVVDALTIEPWCILCNGLVVVSESLAAEALHIGGGAADGNVLHVVSHHVSGDALSIGLHRLLASHRLFVCCDAAATHILLIGRDHIGWHALSVGAHALVAFQLLLVDGHHVCRNVLHIGSHGCAMAHRLNVVCNLVCADLLVVGIQHIGRDVLNVGLDRFSVGNALAIGCLFVGGNFLDIGVSGGVVSHHMFRVLGQCGGQCFFGV